MSRKDEVKKIADELYTLNYQIEQLNARLMLLSNSYTEYIAKNVDALIGYAEHLAEVYSSNMSGQSLGNIGFASPRHALTFDEYKKIMGVS
jgi:hypothetical protein